MSAPTLDAVPLRRRERVDPLLLLPVGAAGALFATWWSLSAGKSDISAAVDLAVAWAFVAAACLALSKVTFRSSGILMTAVAASWFVTDLQLSTVSVLWTVGFVFGELYLAFLVQLVVGFPEGRPWSPVARIVVASTYVATVGLSFVRALFYPSAHNLLLVRASEQRADTIDQISAVFGAAIAIAFAVLVLARLLRLRGVGRRVAMPMLVGALLATPVTLVRLVAVIQGNDGLSDRLEAVDRFATIFIPLGFIVGLGWSRLRRVHASTLVVELRDGGAGTMRDRLSRALGDPSLEIHFYVEHSGGYVDSAGHPVELANIERAGRAVTHVVAQGSPAAMLVHDPALLDEPDLVASVRETAGLFLENERLAAEIRAQLAEVQASRARIVAAADEERRRLERDLHDGAQQHLVGLSLKLALAQIGADPAAADAFANAQGDLERALAELREFARGVHPSVLREEGLDAGVEALVRRTPIPVEIVGSAGERLPDAVELAAYFLVSESLANIVKHARATHATVSVSRAYDSLVVVITDDGVGGANAGWGTGLSGLSDRLAALEGSLEVVSPPGSGTTLTARIPCAS